MLYKFPVIALYILLASKILLSQFQSEAPAVIDKENIQAEVKFIYEKGRVDDNEEHSNYSLPALLLRYGISDNIEVQTNLQYFTEKCGSNKVSGFQPVKAGLKFQLNNNNEFPAAAFLINLSLSGLASEDFRTNNIAPEIIFTAAYEFKDITLCCNLGLLWDGEQTDPYRYYDLSLSYSPVRYLSVFAESFGFLKSMVSADNRFDAGISLFVIKNFQIDISAGTGLSKYSPDKFFYLGIAFNSGGF